VRFYLHVGKSALFGGRMQKPDQKTLLFEKLAPAKAVPTLKKRLFGVGGFGATKNGKNSV
jgi:hypothetical protein